MATVNLHPSGTVSGNQNWTINNGGSTAHAVLADSDDTTYIKTAAQSQYCVVEVDNYTAGGTVDSIRWYVRGAYALTRSGDIDMQVVLGTGSHAPVSGSADAHYSETFTLTFNAGYARQDYYGTARTTSDGASTAWNIGTLNSLRLDINTSPVDPPGISQAWGAKAYVEVTYEPVAVTDNTTFFGTNF